MNNNYIQELKHDTTRQVVITHVGNELPIKEHNGWCYMQVCVAPAANLHIARVVPRFYSLRS